MMYGNNVSQRPCAFIKPEESGQQAPADLSCAYGNSNAPMPMQVPNNFPVGTTLCGIGQNGMGATINLSTMQAGNTPVYSKLYCEQESAAIQIGKKEVEAFIEVAKKNAMEIISTAACEERAKLRADISSRRELQTTGIQICQDGKIMVKRELFGQDASQTVQFHYKDSCRLKCIGREEKEVLEVTFQKENGAEVRMFMDMAKLEARYINKQFNRAGIKFGFSYSKETQLRCQLIIEVFAISREKWIPQKHGWYKNQGKIGYVYPETLVWEEVEQYV